MIWCICRAKFGAWHTGSAQYGQLSGTNGNGNGGSGGSGDIDPTSPTPRMGSDEEQSWGTSAITRLYNNS